MVSMDPINLQGTPDVAWSSWWQKRTFSPGKRPENQSATSVSDVSHAYLGLNKVQACQGMLRPRIPIYNLYICIRNMFKFPWTQPQTVSSCSHRLAPSCASLLSTSP